MRATGLLLAAGAGSRMGRPKALVAGDDGEPWLVRSVRLLLDGGCDDVLVVLGAAASQAHRLLADHVGPDESVDVVEAEAWAEGLSGSLRAGLDRLADGSSDAAVVLLVDLPDLVPAVVARLLPAGPGTLARASYAGEPGHPVVLGREHWPAVAAGTSGDHGARSYLRAHADDVVLVECGDLATGRDQDRPNPQ